MNVFKDRLEKKNIKKKTKCLLLTMLTLKANSVMKICRFPIQSYLKDNLHVLVSHFSVKHDFSFLEDIRSFLSMTHSVPQALCVIWWSSLICWKPSAMHDHKVRPRVSNNRTLVEGFVNLPEQWVWNNVLPKNWSSQNYSIAGSGKQFWLTLSQFAIMIIVDTDQEPVSRSCLWQN